MALFWRIFLLNAVVLVAATALLLGPVTVSTPVLLTEAAVLTVGLAAMLVANALLLRVGLAPLKRLVEPRSSRPSRPGGAPQGHHAAVGRRPPRARHGERQSRDQRLRQERSPRRLSTTWRITAREPRTTRPFGVGTRR